ncbi:hypothetical protein E4U42_002497 [Claviceps africana]|uniref:Gastric mucin n=1 Tax=Claviceps africana TaxID=83212 RepID=A0A8K0NM89_9HYPO|nr:hypothetical protein E4U42_002497 [Claviceps africana]
MAIGSLMGSIVALEGEPDLVSTQLRLLPISPQLLILPSIEHYVKPGDRNGCFSARGFVQQIHAALVARNDAARTFLDGSMEDHKRLVFLHGSTPGAQTLCVKQIMKYETNGNRAEAEAIFEEIVKDGVAGLNDHSSNLDLDNQGSGCSYTVNNDDNVKEDAIMRAMRAADALDRQTADLQPSDGMVPGLPFRPRSSSLPLYGSLDEFADPTPFYVFGALRPDDEESSAEDDDVETVSALPTLKATMFSKPTQHTSEIPKLGSWCQSPSICSTSCFGEIYRSRVNADGTDAMAGSPASEAFSLESSDNVVFGEASVLDMRLSSRRSSISRVKSLDRIYPASPRFRDLSIPTQSWLDDPDSPRTLQHSKPATWLSDAQTHTSSQMSILERPRKIVVRPRLSSVQVRPVPVSKKRKKAKEAMGHARPNYVDRGTDAWQSLAKDSRYLPVLPPVEDIVVNLVGNDSADILFESAISAFKYHRFPPLSYSPTPSDADNNDGSTPGTPIQPSSESGDKLRVHCKESDVLSPSAEDYDPFSHTHPSWQLSKSSDLTAMVSTVQLPATVQTAPPAVSESDNKFHEFHVAPGETAISIQNSLRSILSGYFPPDTAGYRQFHTSLLPEFDELWRPLFRGGSSHRDDGSLIQILATGSQKGVSKEYLQGVTGRLEKVGTKLSEFVETGRVDFRYLLANAMQAFTAQRLANQTDNPFTNSYLLATLIIPHLETYLTLHTHVRYLLLVYSPEHLAIVLALQKLIGVDIMKVVHSVESTSKEASSFTHIRGTSTSTKNTFESRSLRSFFSAKTTSSDIAISGANYLLASTASEKHIESFVSTAWNAGTLEPDMSAPSTATARAHEKVSMSLRDCQTNCAHITTQTVQRASSAATTHAPPSRAFAPATVARERPSPAASRNAASISETNRKPKWIKSQRSQSKLWARNMPQLERESLTSLEYSDDSDDDMDERRLMPVFMQKHRLGKPDSRKALKFLGLA